MGRHRDGVVEGYQIADAQKMDGAAGKHAAEVAKFGITDPVRKKMHLLIGQAIALAAVPAPAEPTVLEEARQMLKDSVGRYRRSADLVGAGPGGRDKEAEAALQAKGRFPHSDTQLRKYVSGIARRMKSYAAKLAACGFSREDQDKLVAQSHSFMKALAARGKERGEQRATRLQREAVFAALRDMTSFMRRAGRAALHDSNQIADFNRVQIVRRSLRAVPPPVPAPAPAMAAGTKS